MEQRTHSLDARIRALKDHYVEVRGTGSYSKSKSCIVSGNGDAQRDRDVGKAGAAVGAGTAAGAGVALGDGVTIAPA